MQVPPYNGEDLKNYESEKNLRTKSLLTAFDVTPEPEAWDKLFCLIEKVYCQRDSWNYDSYSNGLVGFCTKYKEKAKRDNIIAMVK